MKMNDPLSSDILAGYTGANFVDTGYFYTPFVPLTQTPVVLDPNTAIPTRGILTRYGKKILEAGKQYYGGEFVKKKEYRSIDEPFEVSYSEE